MLFTGAIAILALASFASALEGYLFGPMGIVSRLLVVPGTVMMFWPDHRLEAAGAALLLAILAGNWLGARRATAPG